MIIVKKRTKKAASMIENYEWHTRRNGLVSLEQVYSNASVYKWRAWHNIEDLCRRMNGYGLSVLGYNCMKYTAAFKAVVDGVEKLFYFTADYDYCVEI